MTKDDEIEKNMNGYSETEQMLKNYTANVQGSYSAFESIRKYRNSNKILMDLIAVHGSYRVSDNGLICW